MKRLFLSLICLLAISAVAEAGCRVPLLSRVRERHVERHRTVTVAKPAAVQVSPKTIPLTSGGCANGQCARPGIFRR